MTLDPFSPDMTFEEAYKELESIVLRLEAGSLTLDESLGLYERGQALSKWCETQLDSAELRVSQLADDGSESELS